jgi:phage protein D
MRPHFRADVSGVNFSGTIPNITKFTITDKRAYEADTLALEISDPKNEFEVPEEGAIIDFYLGFDDEPQEHKGAFIVDGDGYTIKPRTIMLYARSANLKETFNIQRSESYNQTTLGDIVGKIAGRQGTALEINSELANLTISHLDQTNESDGHLLTRLGRMFGAIATVKDKRLVFTPLSRGATPAGTPLSARTISEADCDDFTYNRRRSVETYDKIIARYHDLDMAKTISIEITRPGAAGTKPKTLPQTFPDNVQATAAARAELRRISDMSAAIDITLAKSDPGLIPETPIRLSGFKTRIDNARWVTNDVTLDGSESAVETRFSLVLQNDL